MRIIFALFIFFNTTVCFPAFFNKNEQGAYIEIQKQDGVFIKGELFAVRRNMVIVQMYSYGSYEYINLSDIAGIKIQKDSRLLSAGIGFLRGCITGAVIGDLSLKSNPTKSDKTMIPIIGGAVGGLIGAIIGQFKGTPIKKYDIYIFKGKSPIEIIAILSVISSKARIRD